MVIKNISPAIDACAGMIAKRVNQTYYRLADVHKRWIDPEDVLQEHLIAALHVYSRYDVQRGKFSTFLHRGLENQSNNILRQVGSGAVGKRQLRQQMRFLDDPVGTDEGKQTLLDLIPSTDPNQEVQERNVGQFLSLCSALRPEVGAFLVGGLLCGSWTPRGCRRGTDASFLNEIRIAAAQKNITIEELRAVLQDEKSRTKVLIVLANSTTMVSGVDLDARVLQCVGKLEDGTPCTTEMGLSAVRRGRFFLETMTCLSCYLRLQAAHPTESCFGKTKVVQNGRVLEGYSEADAECRLHCTDRKICRKFIKGEIDMKNMAKKNAAEAIEDVDLSDVDVKAKKSKKVEKAEAEPAKSGKGKATAKGAPEGKSGKGKAEKGEKEPKEPKAKKTDDPDSHLPWKRNSMMRYAIALAIKPEGVKEEALKAEVEKGGVSWKTIRKCLTSGHAGKTEHTHTWKVEIENGRIRVYDLKPTTKAKKTA